MSPLESTVVLHPYTGYHKEEGSDCEEDNQIMGSAQASTEYRERSRTREPSLTLPQTHVSLSDSAGGLEHHDPVVETPFPSRVLFTTQSTPWQDSHLASAACGAGLNEGLFSSSCLCGGGTTSYVGTEAVLSFWNLVNPPWPAEDLHHDYKWQLRPDSSFLGGDSEDGRSLEGPARDSQKGDSWPVIGIGRQRRSGEGAWECLFDHGQVAIWQGGTASPCETWYGSSGELLLHYRAAHFPVRMEDPSLWFRCSSCGQWNDVWWYCLHCGRLGAGAQEAWLCGYLELRPQFGFEEERGGCRGRENTLEDHGDDAASLGAALLTRAMADCHPAAGTKGDGGRPGAPAMDGMGAVGPTDDSASRAEREALAASLTVWRVVLRD